MQLATLLPDNSFLRHVEGAFVFLMKDALNWIIYMEPLLANPAKINLQIPAGNYLVEWTDVLSGKKTEKVQFTKTQAFLISPAGINDKVVKLRKMRAEWLHLQPK